MDETEDRGCLQSENAAGFSFSFVRLWRHRAADCGVADINNWFIMHKADGDYLGSWL